jgi:peptide/nickel transport system substrate-binding protein
MQGPACWCVILIMDHSQVPFNSQDDWKSKLTKERRWRIFGRFEDLLRGFSPSERLFLYGLTCTLALGAFLFLIVLNGKISTVIPAAGGTQSEGEVGPARFINPVLETSQPDQDLTQLVYSGLVRAMPDGTTVPDLAQSYQISADGTVYTFKLRPDATFQDGTHVTAADVLYTVSETRKPGIKSPRRADWEGVAISAPDPSTVVFTLPHPYAPFIENTTLGILPSHLWQNVTDEEFPFNPLNTHPIGSGPYKITGVTTDKTGSATRYDLSPFNQFIFNAPYLSKISFVFYPDQNALLKAFNAGQIDAIAGVSPTQVGAIKRTDTTLIRVPLPRLFGVFFNQSHSPVLADLGARAALDAAIDKNALVQKILNGYGVALSGPIPPGALEGDVTNFAGEIASSSATSTPISDPIAQAQGILQNNGWKFNTGSGIWEKNKQPLTFTLATADEPELVATANTLAALWRKVGILVTVKVYPLAELNQNVIRPRNYDALLFGEVVGREGDLFAFWHSSQRNDPGLNLAMYANSITDSLLSQARAQTDDQKRAQLYAQFAALVQKDHPAVFLYAPEFIYIVPRSLHGVELGALTFPSDRFWNVYQWYTQTQHVWDIFLNK